MTVQTNTNVASFNGDGANKVFPIGYKFNSAADLVVLLVDDVAVTTQILTLNSDFTVTGAGDEEGGAVTLVVAPAASQRLTIIRIVDILQLTDLRNQGKFYAEIHEDAFDLLTMIAQQHQSDIALSLRVAETDPEPARIPSVAQRAGKLLAFDADGNPTAALPAADSSTELRQELGVAAGAGEIGFSASEPYPAGSIGEALKKATAGFVVNVLANGAKGDGVTDDTAAIRACIATLKMAGGGTLYFPKGRYYVTTSDPNFACLWIDFNGVRITGDGELSEIFTTANDHVPIHVCAQESMATSPGAVDVIDGFICENIHVKGTGVYQYYSLAKGRGILIRRAKNCFVRNNWVTGMSMIGICTEAGQGNFYIAGNRIKDCRYTAINFNGRAYNSIIEGNICSGSNAGVNSCVIQVNGPCIVRGNTIYGDVVDYANCGGIMWGEGPYDGIGLIEGNLILHCRYGIKSIYHGSVSITNNVLINCRGTHGIICGGGTSGAFTVENSHNLIANNLLINCAPYQIETSAPNTMITGNMVRNIASPTLPSATSEPDAIFAVTVQAGIRVRAPGCSITNNTIDGGVRGISTTLGQTDGTIQANTILSASSTFYAVEADSGTFIAVSARTRESLGGSTYVDQVVSGSIPGTGYYPNGSRWRPSAYVIGQPVGAIVLQSRIDSVATTAGAGSTTVDIVGAANFVGGSNCKVGIKLDNGSFHWTTVSTNTGNTLTLAAAIPAGRSAPAGNPVYVTQWRAEANLA